MRENLLKLSDLLGLFSHPSIQLPQYWNIGQNSSFTKYFTELFHKYEQILPNSTPEIKFFLHEFSKILNTTIREYYKGKTASAYQIFVKKAVPIFIPSWSNLNTPFDPKEDYHFLYRARVTDQQHQNHHQIKTQGDLFHIPFQLRHLVESQRYSIPGLPCLYLGKSIYCCWEELGRPDINWLYISLFKYIGPPEFILDFSWTPRMILEHISNQDIWIKLCILEESGEDCSKFLANHKEFFDDCYQWLIDSAICWPIVAVCSTHVQNANLPFNPHYIVPQMVLQYVVESEIYLGIQYFSSQLEENSMLFPGLTLDNSRRAVNFVFPSSQVSETGWCENLRKYFYNSYPISYQSLIATHPAVFGGRFFSPPDLSGAAPTSINYKQSVFGRLEEILKNQHFITFLEEFFRNIEYEFERNGVLERRLLQVLLTHGLDLDKLERVMKDNHKDPLVNWSEIKKELMNVSEKYGGYAHYQNYDV